ncbi:transglycosylase SLT domain-containing protein [Aquimonas voraii]|uniref:Soluble lytic murein transglycosylase n=1 Tax=Aquimonas voraii TaxID=265719 RepID=A0A1G6YK10_9GAMM|nr:transglycosylase SLT domain-containing protein [Aquimonas voraii]SDD90739.1 soluble lytic murein transglycosylase [Aquimonas voraii]
MLKRLLIALPCLLALSAALPARAQTLPASDAERLSELRRALADAPKTNDREFLALARRLGGDPLWPWVEQQHLRGRDVHLHIPEAIDFLDRHGEAPVGAVLRRAVLLDLAKRRDWSGFQRIGLGPGDGDDPELRCHALTARFAQGDDATVVDDALSLWDRGDSLPAACDPAIEALRRIGRLDAARQLRRIEAAATLGNAGLMRHLAASLAPDLRGRIEAEARFIESPAAGLIPAASSTPRTRAAVEAGLSALARRDPAAAESLLDALAAPLTLEGDRVARLRHAIALWSAASYLPEADNRFARVPAEAFDDRLHEWRVREAIARRDGAAALAALAAMPAALREQARWRLIEARLLAARGDNAAAQVRLSEAATEANFHGFLAAELAGLDYPLCPLPAASGRSALRALERAGVRDALDLHALGRPGWAHRQWQHAMADLPPDQQALAVAAALRHGWYDRASQTLGSGEGMRYYRERFPRPHATTLRREARRHGLQVAWVAGLIRAESSWMTAARSAADARGLMQLLPATGRDTARRQGLGFSGPQSLHQADLNIALGTAYLRQMLDAHAGKPGLATAAYNAGPAAVARWLAARPPVAPLLDDPLLWLETIPFQETREYVARVMAFSLIYDWRMEGRAPSLLGRLEGRASRGWRDFRCPGAPP